LNKSCFMEKHSFQAEIQKVLDIVVNSLYTDKEVFIRELVSNASDACEKVRFMLSSGQTVYQPDVAPAISVKLQEKEKQVTIVDTGCGMTKEELLNNLGTIAHSGTKAFIKNLQEKKTENKDGTSLIGQFGVGFYSAFMVAKTVTVYTRSSQNDSQGWKWVCTGMDGYEIEPADDLPRGTKIVLDLKDDAGIYAEKNEVERLLRHYSSFVQFPVDLDGTSVNTVKALWARSKNEIKPEEYTEFYKYISHDVNPPLLKLHFTADAPLMIQSLLFVPDNNIEKMGLMRLENGVNLYCKRVLIEANSKDLLPEWMRFVKGVVDSEDLPLNISRETMQDSGLMRKLNRVITGRFLKFLEETAKTDPENYTKFYTEFNRMIKEGVLSDFEHREALARLLRFESSSTEEGKMTSFADYVSRMGSEQKEIYYIVAPHRKAAEASPYYEGLKSKNMEVLFCYDSADSFVMEHLLQFEGKTLKPAEQAEITVDQASEQKLGEKESKLLTEWFKELLGDKVKEVKVSQRLVDSPAAIVSSDKYMTTAMRHLLKSIHKDGQMGDLTYDLEINPSSPVICQLFRVWDNRKEIATEVAWQIYDNACVAAGIIDDFAPLVKRMNKLMEATLKTF